jgi:hypothetical protein
MFTCKSEKRTVIGYLDSTTRIVAAERFFVIERKSLKKDKWIGWHYYSDFADLLRAYLRLLWNREEPEAQGQSKTVLQILDRVLVLDRKIEEAASRLQGEWKKILEDPIERTILKGGHAA